MPPSAAALPAAAKPEGRRTTWIPDGYKRSPGHSSWPRLEPRPVYPPWYDIAAEALLGLFRGHVIKVVLYQLVFFPFYLKIAKIALEDYGLHESVFFGLSVLGAHHTSLIFSNFVFGLVPYGFPSVFDKYRLPELPEGRPSRALVEEALWFMIPGTIGIAITACLGHYLVLKPICGFPHPLDETVVAYRFGPEPGITKFAQIWLLLLWNHITATLVFHTVHQIIHDAKYYAKIHKKHHRFINTVSISAEFADPIEGSPSITGPIALGPHPAFFVFFLMVDIFGSAEGHSGYCFSDTFLYEIGLTRADDASYHHCHHRDAFGNFSQPWLDWLCGTCDYYVAVGWHEGYQKHGEQRKKQILAMREEKKKKSRRGRSRSVEARKEE